jgi:membrane-associated phospholipid phosphatase
VVAVAIGGALIEPAPAAAFALAAVVVGLAALPTLTVGRRLALGERAETDAPPPERAPLREALHRQGAREVLLAQTLWVFAYAALPAFFVLYAEHSLGLSVAAAGVLPLGFGALTALGMLVGARARPEHVRPLLLAGAAMLGVGILAAAPADGIRSAAPAFAVAALGAGLVTALGFPYFARFVPDGEAGRYSGLFFAGRAVATTAALPLAGLAVEASGGYDAVLWLGAAALVALVPLTLVERATGRPVLALPRPSTVAAVVPVFASDRAAEVARAALRHVDELVLVDDGAPPPIAASLEPVAADERVRVLRLERNGGKGSAVSAGIRLLLDEPRPPEAIVVLDSDGQHDPERIPAFVEAAGTSDVVIGHRRDRRAMPLERRLANRLASLLLAATSRAWVPDTQNGMRLFRTAALRHVPLPPGGYEAESRHLRALLASGHELSSVEIPTIYDGEPSGFRRVADTARVARALVAPPAGHAHAAGAGSAAEALAVLRAWAPRLSTGLLAAIALGLALPLFQPLDNSLYLAVNRLGDGPEWLYHALDPHTRNYIVLILTTLVTGAVTLRRPRYVIGAALGVLLAAYLAGAAIEVIKLFVERARPEEVLGAEVLLSEGRSWAHLASYPSGHLIVTAAMAAAAASALPVLRRPLLAYVVMIGFTRVLFGAHFPLDVLVGAVMGYELGLFAARLMASARLLPAPAEWARARLPAADPLVSSR